MEVLMKRFQLVAIALVVMTLMLACATIGIGEDNNNNNQNQPNQEQNTNTQENQTDEGSDNSQEDSAGNNDDEEDKDKDKNEESDTPATTGGGVEGSLWETDFGKLLESGSLVMESNNANVDSETVGTILTIQFTNPTNDEILVTVPCGLVFTPTETEEQALMMIQPLEVSLAAGESAEYTPYVVCIDMAAPAPALNSGYTIAYLAEEELLVFAECICGQELSTELGSMDSTGVQFATWSITTGGDVMNIVGEEGAAVEEFMEGMELDEFAEMFADLFSTFGGEWLDRCGITVGEE
jgi:hypothetical protein